MGRYGKRRAILASACALLVADCSSSTGGLVVAITTNFAPGNIDEVQLVVTQSSGASAWNEAYALGPVGPSALQDVENSKNYQIPATLVIDAPSGNDPVTVDAIGYLKGKARTFSQIVTTIPRDNEALAYLPVDFLCDGQVTVGSNGTTVSSSCFNSAAGNVAASATTPMTCIAGTCQPSTNNTLPTYSDAQVYGGGTSTAGSCFDVQTCMANLTTLTPNMTMTGCTIDVSSLPTTTNINVAISQPITASSTPDGVCIGNSVGDPCYIMLDESLGAWAPGFTISGSTITLPPGVCTKYQSLTTNPSIVVSAGTGCPTKTAATPICGSWCSLNPNNVSTTMRTVTTVATMQQALSYIAVGSTYLYWTTSDAIGFASVSGGPSMSYPNLPSSGIATSGPDIYWTDEQTGSIYLFNTATAGTSTSAIQLVENQSTPNQLALSPNGNSIVWNDTPTGGPVTVWRGTTSTASLPMSGTELGTQVLSTTTSIGTGYYYGSVTLDNTYAYWTNYDLANGQIMKASLGGGAVATLVTGIAGPMGIAVDTNYVYYTANDGVVRAVTPSGSAPITLATGQGSVGGSIAAQNGKVFWTSPALGEVLETSVGSSQPTVVATGQATPGAIVADNTNIYWLDLESGNVMSATQ